jgi:hypothetical protein
MIWSLFFSLLSIGNALPHDGAAAACTREGLKAAVDSFLSADKALKASESIKIAQNNIQLKGISETVRTSITGFYKPWRINAIDTEACTIASFVLLNLKEGGESAPALVSIRIKTEGDSATVKELEVLNVQKGSHSFFSPQSFPDKEDALWTKPQKGNLSRQQLIDAANKYPSAIQAGDGSGIKGGETCPRFENGVQTAGEGRPNQCYQGLANFKQGVTNRRWTADTVTGVVLGEFYFDKRGNSKTPAPEETGLWLNEYFKIDDGKLYAIQAAMKLYPGKFNDVWKDSVVGEVSTA